jgi:transcription termination factor Rho
MTVDQPRTADQLDLATLDAQPADDLAVQLRRLGAEPGAELGHGDLVLAIVERHLAAGGTARATGVLEVLADGFGFLRSARHDCRPQPHDVFVSPAQIRHLCLRSGQRVGGPVRAPRAGERFLGLAHVDDVQGGEADAQATRRPFAARSPVLPTRRLALAPPDDPELRAVGVLAPWARGHRVLVTLPPDAGGGAWLLRLADALRRPEPSLRLVVALVDQRPEVVAAAHRALDHDPASTVLGAAFDEPPARQVALAELALAIAQREVEAGHDAVLLFDSLTALARACNLDQAPSGRLLCAGLDAAAVQRGKRLFAAARACEGGGTLTVVATTIHGDHAVDRAIGEQFRRRGNSEVAFTAGAVPGELLLDVAGTFTRNEDLPLPRAAAEAWRRWRGELLALAPDRRRAELDHRLAAHHDADAPWAPQADR